MVLRPHPQKGLIYKVLYAYPISGKPHLPKARWGDLSQNGEPRRWVSLGDATKIQNICWMHKLAPRVHDIEVYEEDGKRYWAQVVDEVQQEPNKNYKTVYDSVKDLGQEYGFINEKDDCSKFDVLGNRLVDFNTFHFKKGYMEKIKSKYCEYCRYGKNYYQPVEEWGLTNGPREGEKRIQELKLRLIPFNGYSVMDLGCAGGYFCRYAYDRGNDSVIGIDTSGRGSDDPIKGAYLAANMTGRWGIDYFDMDLTTQRPPVADIVFYLSMNYHEVGIPDWLPEITSFVCVFEDNSKDRDAKKKLQELFDGVEYVGESTDHDPAKPKLIYHCYK
jgi:SAM-dependent methyltransferase